MCVCVYIYIYIYIERERDKSELRWHKDTKVVINASATYERSWEFFIYAEIVHIVNIIIKTNLCLKSWGAYPCVVASVLDCGLEVSEFELHSGYDVHFQTHTLKKIYYPHTPAIG